jgi:protoporphyrin/coproporphyrin ferrochelatase
LSLLLISHGTVDSVADLPLFLKNIRRGHDPSPELVHEVTRRYEAIGGKSPLNTISQSVAKKLSARLGRSVSYAGRLWAPSARDAVQRFKEEGATRVDVLPLAQYSAKIYVDHVRAQASECALETRGMGDWGSFEPLLAAFADRVNHARKTFDDAHVMFTAHSLPRAVVDAGDPYEHEVRASAELLAQRLALPPNRWSVAFQSQGMSPGPGGRPMPWLGPTLEEAFRALLTEGKKRVLLVPIGFLADHVEILYDLDLEAQALCKTMGVEMRRTASLNDSEEFIGVLQALVAQEFA